MHLPAVMDGGPHQMISPGDRWSPTWTVDQPAATLWYHPHLHGSTADHVYRGLAGMFLVDEPGPPLPDTYGVDDIPVIVQDKKFRGSELDDSTTAFTDTGVLGNEILVNGTPRPYLDVTTDRVRLRLLNASNARVYDFAFSTGLAFDQIATDGGLLPDPYRTDRLRLSPGERAEIVVHVPAGTSAVLRSEPTDLGGGWWTDRFAGGDDTLDIMELRASVDPVPNAAVPNALTPRQDIGIPSRTREFDLMGSTQINGRTMDPGRVDEVVTLGSTELWRVHNASGQIHNFHIHDVQFQVLDIDGEPPPPELAGWKDTAFLSPRTTIRLIMRFTDYADPSTPYMYHCHLLRHEDRGLMGQFVVVEPGQEPAPPNHGQAG
jgi:FtsP/CotA-like multicopper oxidase with cupredoxin domain